MPHTKINSKWIKDLNVRPEIMKILEKSISSKVSDIVHSNNFFLVYLLRKGEQKKKVNEWDYIKLKGFCTANETIDKMKRQPIEWENIFANDIFNKGLMSKIYKELTKLNTEKPQTINYKMGRWPK